MCAINKETRHFIKCITLKTDYQNTTKAYQNSTCMDQSIFLVVNNSKTRTKNKTVPGSIHFQQNKYKRTKHKHSPTSNIQIVSVSRVPFYYLVCYANCLGVSINEKRVNNSNGDGCLGDLSFLTVKHVTGFAWNPYPSSESRIDHKLNIASIWHQV